MNKPIISVEQLSKAYRLGLKHEVADTMVGAVTNTLTAPLRNWKKLQSLDVKEGGEAEDVLWALKDVTFDVYEGDVIGIIGRNGAGKSTLLKILSRITEPTSGFAKLRGRVSSLLEVGTGFHPELTGRDNIYMNGTILGMKKQEIDRKFDEIVDFSGVEKFLDTPVKRYSSGMQVRLAFAVAAHLEPEILVIDEVLAVGDVEFQQKCLGKMRDVSTQGRTVLFVSHNMAATRSLCEKGILIEEGTIARYGSVDDVINRYLGETANKATIALKDRLDRSGSGDVLCQDIQIYEKSGLRANGIVTLGSTVEFRIRCQTHVSHIRYWVILSLYRNGQKLTSITSDAIQSGGKGATNNLICAVPHFPFCPGTYSVNVAIMAKSRGFCDHIENAAKLSVVGGGHGEDVYDATQVERAGLVLPQNNWLVTNS